MEARIIKETKTELEVEIVGEDHTFCNALRQTLGAHKDVLFAAYKIEHPLLSSPKIYIKTRDVALPKGKEKIVPLDEVKGIGPKRAEELKKAGIKSANALLKADIEKLEKKSGISAKILEKYVGEAKTLDLGKESIPKFVLKESLKELEKTFSELKKKFD
ncbi:MAG: RpoL/Rpb11 RNA polymerase subunit family protein [Candidatus Hydrothermarchaeota archaeon]|nr:RpoL/Rpb11 RNA polymerase subunit family protein [Candidatus Hydrothermarchaeota archaeon]